MRRDPRPAIKVSYDSVSLTLGGTGFESWWVHEFQVPFRSKDAGGADTIAIMF